MRVKSLGFPYLILGIWHWSSVSWLGLARCLQELMTVKATGLASTIYLPIPHTILVHSLEYTREVLAERGQEEEEENEANTRGTILCPWLLSNNWLEKVPFVSVLHTSSNRLLLSNQDKGCTPSVAHSLPLPLGPALLNLWIIICLLIRFSQMSESTDDC